MGFPFDRNPPQGVDRLSQFLTPNMRVQNVLIRFNNRTVIRNPQRAINERPPNV